MIPKIQAKFRRRLGIPFAVEHLSGIQFRCRHCNIIYLTKKELDHHLKEISVINLGKKLNVSTRAPKLNANTDIRVLYTYDVKDMMGRQFLRSDKDDDYDGQT